MIRRGLQGVDHSAARSGQLCQKTVKMKEEEKSKARVFPGTVYWESTRRAPQAWETSRGKSISDLRLILRGRGGPR